MSGSPSTRSGSSKLSSDIEKVEMESMSATPSTAGQVPSAKATATLPSSKTPSPPLPHPPSPPPVRVIPEIFQDYNEMGYKQSVRELDAALDDGCAWIIVEPLRLGDETARWIAVGNFLHKYTVVTGLSAAVGLGLAPRQWMFSAPLAASATLTFAIYQLSWAPDPASKYQVETRREALASLSLPPSSSGSLLVLRRRDDAARQALHSAAVGLLAAVALGRAAQAWWSA